MSRLQHTGRLTGHPPRYPNRIRHYRLKAGLSQRALAGLIHRRASSISAWECGQHLPSIVSLFQLARKLDTLSEALYWELYTVAKRDAGDTTTGA